MWISCQAIAADKNLTTEDKLKLWKDVYASFPQQPRTPKIQNPPMPRIVILDFTINQEGPVAERHFGTIVAHVLIRKAHFTVYNEGEAAAVDCQAHWQPLHPEFRTTLGDTDITTDETPSASPTFGIAPKEKVEFTYIASARLLDPTAKVSGTSSVQVNCLNNIVSNKLERYVDYDKKGLTY